MNVRIYSKYLSLTILSLCVVFAFIFLLNLYPLKYKSIIKNYSNMYGVSGEIVASLINAESSFDKNSVSDKGAVGLMQIVPKTAQWLAGKEGLEYSYDRLFDAEYNIRLGVSYLKYLINKFEVLDTAIVAYNAGEGNVSRWLEYEQYSEDGKVLKKIPFKESENYLKKIKNSLGIYKIRLVF